MIEKRFTKKDICFYRMVGIIGMFVLMVFSSVNAQSLDRGIDIGAGYETNGYLARLSYHKVFGEKHMVRIAGQFHQESYDLSSKIDVQLYLGNLEYYYELFDLNRGDFLVFVGGGALGGYENIKTNDLPNGAEVAEGSNFIYGGHLGGELEKYLTEINNYGSTLSLVLNVRHNYILNSDLGNSLFNATLGLRFYF